MRTLKIIAFILTIVGAINWGLVGFFKIDLVAALFGQMSFISRVVYAAVGFSGLYSLITLYDVINNDF